MAAHLTITQRAFEFADRLQYHYHNKVTSDGINATLLQYLGVEKYRQFCRNFQQNNPKEAVPLDSFAHFREAYAENPLWHANMLFDEHVRYFWTLGTIMNEVKKLL